MTITRDDVTRLSDDDIRDIRERLSLSDASTWGDLAALWDARDPEMGEPDVPHEFALRFIHEVARHPDVLPVSFYLRLRESFFQAMTVVVGIHEPGQRYFK